MEKKLKNTYRKLMDLQMLRQQHYYICEIPLSQQIFPHLLKFYIYDQDKEESFQNHKDGSTYNRMIKNWLKYTFFRRSNSTKFTELKIYMVDRECYWNIGFLSLIHDPRPKWESVQEE